MGTAEHPAINAAREIRQLHLDNIKMIDDGFVFNDKDGNSVNDTMRAACQEQIALCDNIIDEAWLRNKLGLEEPMQSYKDVKAQRANVITCAQFRERLQ